MEVTVGKKELDAFLRETTANPVIAVYYAAREVEDALTSMTSDGRRLCDLAAEARGPLSGDELRELSGRAGSFLSQAESLVTQAESLRNLAQAAALRGTRAEGK